MPAIRQAIADCRAQIYYLPAYSPEMNAIEMASSKPKRPNARIQRQPPMASSSVSAACPTASTRKSTPTSFKELAINGHC